ncbi:hypothetical protein Hanom_Chr10g00944751 [Helianthus anomalus]
MQILVYSSIGYDSTFFGSCFIFYSSDVISPILSLWATLIGLYMANFDVQRSSGWALTHPLSVEEIKKLKAEQTQPTFWIWTSSNLFKTLFDLLVSVTIFVGRFDMRIMHAAMNGNCEGAKQEDFL